MLLNSPITRSIAVMRLAPFCSAASIATERIPWVTGNSCTLAHPAHGHCTKPWAHKQPPQVGKVLWEQSQKLWANRSQLPQVVQGENGTSLNRVRMKLNSDDSQISPRD